MRKLENTRTLCDYYNEIVYKVNQLTEMCGNTDEAIKIRDDIYDMFTVKFSEPLDDIAELQEELGCPLTIVGRLLLHKERYIYTVEKSKLTGEYFMDKHTIVGVSEFGVCIVTTNYILKTEPKYYKWNEYKKTWWLREDKSE